MSFIRNIEDHHPQTPRNFGLDVIRASAIGMVLVCHFTMKHAQFTGTNPPAWLSIGGLFGVELFFVLSGFLIGGILLRMARTGADFQDWLIFMVRRWMRTLPLYYFWIIFLALFFPPDSETTDHVIRYLTITQNLFTSFPADGWFPVSWSLAVEEWFYLIFSIVFLGAAALSRRPSATWIVIGAFIVAGIVLRLELSGDGDFMRTSYKIVALRLDAIAYGVAVVRLDPARVRHSWILAVLFLLGLLVIGFLWAEVSILLLPMPHGFIKIVPTATAVGFALMFPAVIRWSHSSGPLAAAVRQTSAQSYSLYIVHLAVLEAMWIPVAGYGMPNVLATPLAAIITVALSWTLWRFIEMPLIARRPALFGRKSQSG